MVPPLRPWRRRAGVRGPHRSRSGRADFPFLHMTGTMLGQAVVRLPTPAHAHALAHLYRIASGVRMALLGFVGEGLDGEVHDVAGDGRADGAEAGWDHSRLSTRKTELVQGAGGDVVDVVGQRATPVPSWAGPGWPTRNLVGRSPRSPARRPRYGLIDCSAQTILPRS